MRTKRAQTMIATLIVIAIILVLVVILFRGYYGGHIGADSPRQDKLGKTVPGLAVLAAKDDVCRNNLSQDRSSIQIFHSTNGDEGYPAKLEDLRLGHDFCYCPVGHERYTYDPNTGEVHCPHPGHEKY